MRRAQSQGTTLGPHLPQHLLWAPWQELGRQKHTGNAPWGVQGDRGVPSAGHTVVPQKEPHRATWRPRQEALSSAAAGGTAGPGPGRTQGQMAWVNATLPALLGDWDKPTPASASHPNVNVRGGLRGAEHQGQDAWEGPSASPPRGRQRVLPSPPLPDSLCAGHFPFPSLAPSAFLLFCYCGNMCWGKNYSIPLLLRSLQQLRATACVCKRAWVCVRWCTRA